jgi:outer membrane protein assembly factor BamD
MKDFRCIYAGRMLAGTLGRVTLGVVVLSLPLGCSSTPKEGQKTAAKSVKGTDEQIFLGDTIEKNYDPNVIMKRAESFFDKEEYHEAVIEYQHFLDLHRIHVLAPYAQFRLGESFMKMSPWVDRDSEPIYKALEAFEKLRREFPGSRYDTPALERIHACHEFIAQTHFMVGEFYYRREAYLAAAHRFENILRDYPDMGVASDALYYLALTYRDLGAEEWAREKLVMLAERYPNHKYKPESEQLLAALNGKAPNGAASSSLVAQAKPGLNGSANGANGSSAVVTDLAVPQPPTAAIPTVTSLPSTTPASISANQTLCRLGVWC